MSASQAPFLHLALGNDLLGDDGVALAAGRALKQEFSSDFVDFIESSEAGLRLMELMSGYEKALLIDSVKTEQCEPGTILEFQPGDFRRVIAPSPHYAGIPEVLDMAERLQIPFPSELRILAVEVVNPFEFQEKFSEPVESALPQLIEKSRGILRQWQEQKSCTNIR